jgi:dienelactone hydrolase
MAVALVVGPTAGCDDATPVTVTMTVSEEAPAYGTTPFPTDALRDGDRLGRIAGLDALAGRNADLVAAHIAALDGFGVRPLVELFLDGDLDPASIPARTTELTDAAVLVDVDPASPERGRVIAMDWRHDPTRRVLAGSPASGSVLREGTRYAAFVTTQIRAASGDAIEASPALTALVSATPARWASTAEAHGELTAALATADVAGSIAGLAVFTTEHATAPLLAAREQLETAPAPELVFAEPSLIFAGTAALDRILGIATRATDGPRAGLERWGNDNLTGIAHDHVGVVATGTISVVRFRGDDTGTDGPEDEAFQLDATGAPRIIAIDRIPITFILPAAAPPAAGYPVVIYGHGLGAGRDQLLSFAEPLTSQGFAVVGIDMFGHGSRFDPIDEVANMSKQLRAFTGEAATPDGFGDRTGLPTQLEFFEGFRAVAAVRDAIRQSALDLSRVTQLLHRADLDLSALAGPGGVPRLDTRRIAYLGESFGTVVGTLVAAIEPDLDLFVLDVPGGGIVDLLMPTSAEIGAIALPYVETVYDPATPLDRWNPLIGLMQAVIDGADPLTYAPHVLRDRFAIAGRTLGPRSVVAIEVIGDQVLANVGTDALAQALGLDVLAPYLDLPAGLSPVASPAAGNRDGQTAVLVQYAPATHGANWSAEKGTLRYMPEFPQSGEVRFPLLPDPVTIDNPIYETLAQVFEVLQSHQAGEAPRVRMTKIPVHDFDGDGTPDDQDPAPYDPGSR